LLFVGYRAAQFAKIVCLILPNHAERTVLRRHGARQSISKTRTHRQAAQQGDHECRDSVRHAIDSIR